MLKRYVPTRLRRTDAAVPQAATQSELGGKGRATPTRKQAEAARRARLKPPTTRKEAARATRQQRYEGRLKAREAMQTGDDRFLPTRDKGPVKRLVRDIVDSRFNAAEFLLPILIVILLLSIARAPWAVVAVYSVWAATIVVSVVDVLVLARRIKREVAKRFPNESRRGALSYGILRSTQLRRFRLPKPRVKRGATY